jgi:hypothetical protein
MNIANLRHVRFSEFFRLIIFDDFVVLQHVKNGAITKQIQSDLVDFRTLADYLHGNYKISVEIIVANKSISCKSISSKLSRADLKDFANENLKQDAVNIVFYENKFFDKRKSITICYLLLQPKIICILQRVINLDNNILGITCWPVWLISSYFDAFPKDRGKFNASFFTIETSRGWEIIALHEDNFVCYRNVSGDNLDRELETDNTIKYVARICKINPENIAIYSISESIIADFTKKSTNYMNMISNDIDHNHLKFSQYLYRVINLAFVIFFIFIPYEIITEAMSIFDVNDKICTAEIDMASIDRNVLNEIDVWISIDEYINRYQADFRGTLKEYVKRNNCKLLQKASLKLDECSNEIIIEVVDSFNTDYDK